MSLIGSQINLYSLIWIDFAIYHIDFIWILTFCPK